MTELTEEKIQEIAREAAKKAIEESKVEGETLKTHSLPSVHGSPGIVVDEEKARRTPCRCAGPLCFSPGIVGGLDEEQKEWACNPKEEFKSPALRRRLENFREAVDTCKKELEKIPEEKTRERMKTWLQCMGREAEARGIEL